MANVLHDIKVKILQVLRIENKETTPIQVATKLQYTQAFVYAGNDLITADGVDAKLADRGVDSVELVVAFAAVTGLAINWQTDIPPGETDTYANILGNNIPKPVVDIATGVANESQRIPFDLKYTMVGGLIQTMTFDWAVAQTGNIIF